MTRRVESPFPSVRTDGRLLPPGVLRRMPSADEKRLDRLSQRERSTSAAPLLHLS
ncbi:MAG: hypothetical protein DIJKHBIC_02457 [Thermoanaerobaculia bacterium]|nr:hypothetical protein [Thermoanaerobaculia bacterium]